MFRTTRGTPSAAWALLSAASAGQTRSPCWSICASRLVLPRPSAGFTDLHPPSMAAPPGSVPGRMMAARKRPGMAAESARRMGPEACTRSLRPVDEHRIDPWTKERLEDLPPATCQPPCRSETWHGGSKPCGRSRANSRLRRSGQRRALQPSNEMPVPITGAGQSQALRGGPMVAERGPKGCAAASSFGHQRPLAAFALRPDGTAEIYAEPIRNEAGTWKRQPRGWRWPGPIRPGSTRAERFR